MQCLGAAHALRLPDTPRENRFDAIVDLAAIVTAGMLDGAGRKAAAEARLRP